MLSLRDVISILGSMAAVIALIIHFTNQTAVMKDNITELKNFASVQVDEHKEISVDLAQLKAKQQSLKQELSSLKSDLFFDSTQVQSLNNKILIIEERIKNILHEKSAPVCFIGLNP